MVSDHNFNFNFGLLHVLQMWKSLDWNTGMDYWTDIFLDCLIEFYCLEGNLHVTIIKINGD